MRSLLLCLWSVLAIGCAANDPPWGNTEVTHVPVDTPPRASTIPGWSGGVTAVGTIHPAVSHGSVELPAVSPDGQWIAYFEHAANAPHPAPESLVTGRGLGGVSLWVRDLKGQQPARPAVLEGACWPAWAPDSSAVYFVTYDAAGICYLGRFDVVTGQVQRKAFGLRHVLTPAVSPSGYVAVVAYGDAPATSRVHVLDWAATRSLPVPAAAGGAAQITPRWASGADLLFVELTQSDDAGPGNRPMLNRAVVGGDGVTRVTKVANVPLPANVMDALLAQQGLPDPFDAGRGAWMARDGRGIVRLIDLRSGDSLTLPAGTATAAWWDAPWMVAGGSMGASAGLNLIAVSPDTDDDIGPVKLRLLSGMWAPRQIDRATKSITLVGMGDDPDRLAVYQLWLVVAED